MNNPNIQNLKTSMHQISSETLEDLVKTINEVLKERKEDQPLSEAKSIATLVRSGWTPPDENSLMFWGNKCIQIGEESGGVRMQSYRGCGFGRILIGRSEEEVERLAWLLTQEQEDIYRAINEITSLTETRNFANIAKIINAFGGIE